MMSYTSLSRIQGGQELWCEASQDAIQQVNEHLDEEKTLYQ